MDEHTVMIGKGFLDRWTDEQGWVWELLGYADVFVGVPVNSGHCYLTFDC